MPVPNNVVAWIYIANPFPTKLLLDANSATAQNTLTQQRTSDTAFQLVFGESELAR